MEGGGADAAAEALPVEKVTLGAQPLHHVHALLTEAAGVTAAQAQGKHLSHGFLGPGEKSNVLGLSKSPKARPGLVGILNQIPGHLDSWLLLLSLQIRAWCGKAHSPHSLLRGPSRAD